MVSIYAQWLNHFDLLCQIFSRKLNRPVIIVFGYGKNSAILGEDKKG